MSEFEDLQYLGSLWGCFTQICDQVVGLARIEIDHDTLFRLKFYDVTLSKYFDGLTVTTDMIVAANHAYAEDLFEKLDADSNNLITMRFLLAEVNFQLDTAFPFLLPATFDTAAGEAATEEATSATATSTEEATSATANVETAAEEAATNEVATTTEEATSAATANVKSAATGEATAASSHEEPVQEPAHNATVITLLEPAAFAATTEEIATAEATAAAEAAMLPEPAAFTTAAATTEGAAATAAEGVPPLLKKPLLLLKKPLPLVEKPLL